MLRDELIQAVKKLELIARRAVEDQLSGQYQSVFKGRGMDFVDVREYYPGDDIRVIDWNVSARMNQLHIKQFVEERQLTVLLMVDASGSQSFGTKNFTKHRVAAELAAIVAFSAIENNDRVGMVRFADEVESFIPPGQGRKHVLRMMSELLDAEPDPVSTDMSGALEYLGNITSRRTLAFVISDFQSDDFENNLQIAQKRHELVPLMVVDPAEMQLPNVGLLEIEDPETGEQITVDTASKKVRERFAEREKKRRQEVIHTLRKYNADPIVIQTDRDHTKPLVEYFRNRQKRH